MNSPRGLVLLVCSFSILVLGCPSDDGGNDTGAAESGDHHSTGAATADEHGTDEHGTDEHGTGPATTGDDPLATYCACVFANCHEPYHEKWGEDEIASEQACLMEAEGLPVNGEDIEMGNFIECRMHFCELAADDESLCANALGEAVCM